MNRINIEKIMKELREKNKQSGCEIYAIIRDCKYISRYFGKS